MTLVDVDHEELLFLALPLKRLNIDSQVPFF